MPIYQGFVGGSNSSQSLQVDCEKTINWFPEASESPAAPTGAALYPTPGQEEFLATADIEPRAAWSMAGRAFAVVGATLIETYADGSFTVRGTLQLDANPATISYNGTAGGQLFITSGGSGYCYVLATNVLTKVLSGEATMGGMLNARFLAFNITTGRVRLSALNDGTTWDATLYFQRTIAPDPWQSMLVTGSNIWLIGEQTGEVWYDTGAYPQPFAPIPGAVFKYGTPAPFSCAVAGDYVTWLSRGHDGAGAIVAARGYTPQKISTYAVEHALHTINRDETLSDCEVLVYEQEGHQFVAFSFNRGKATWVSDFSMGMLWHQRGTWDGPNGRFNAWGPRVHMYAFGKHIVGSRGSGSLAELDPSFGSEVDGSPIRRVRVGPPLWASSRERLLVSRFEVKLESGLGLSTGQGSNPLVMLRTSNDAKRWSSERTASAGALGDYTKRVVFTRCGSSDTLWVPEVSVTDPIPWRIAGAEIDGSGFAQQRAA